MSNTAAPNTNIGIQSHLSGAAFVLDMRNDDADPEVSDMDLMYRTAALAYCEASEKPWSSTTDCSRIPNHLAIDIVSRLVRSSRVCSHFFTIKFGNRSPHEFM